ncbi:MAG: LuxR family transcriptional regulator [Oscillospiraceae bacterium]|nr:LuxR family transcriptional regulator [Oscillospiraceae bacterium]
MKGFRLSVFKTTAVIFLGFLLTSTEHLAWMYRLMELTSADVSYQLSTVAGYALQAVGIGIFALLLKLKRKSSRLIFIISTLGYTACLFPAILSGSFAFSAVFGLLLSLLCGVIAGYYLYELTESGGEHRAVSFGFGYGAATIGSWLLSVIGGGSLYYGNGVLIICSVLAALSVGAAFIKAQPRESKQFTAVEKPQIKLSRILLICGGVVLLFSLVNNIGFAFSASAVQGGLRVEFSRLFYAIGLIGAGFVTDKSRKYGAVCALAALVIPFIVLALRGELFSASVFWAIGYFAFGFYSVYRAILFSDIARDRGIIYLSGFGLLIGRVGDSLGSEINALLSGSELALVVCAAVLFIGSVFLFIRLLQIMYVPVAQRKNEREIFDDFSLSYNLSARERDVLRLLLDDKTNKEISEEICVSENTIKFHVRNLLKKTGCKSRVELKTVYRSAH